MSDARKLAEKLMDPEIFCEACPYSGEPNGCNHPSFVGGCTAWDLAQDAADMLLEMEVDLHDGSV